MKVPGWPQRLRTGHSLQQEDRHDHRHRHQAGAQPSEHADLDLDRGHLPRGAAGPARAGRAQREERQAVPTPHGHPGRADRGLRGGPAALPALLPRQRRALRERARHHRRRLRRGHRGGRLLRGPRHRSRFRHSPGQPRDGLHPGVREPVRDRGHLQPDQLPGPPRAREPARLRGPLQVVLQPRHGHPGVRARGHGDAGVRGRATGRADPLLRLRAARAQRGPPRAALLSQPHVRPEVLRAGRGRPPLVGLPGPAPHDRHLWRHGHLRRGARGRLHGRDGLLRRGGGPHVGGPRLSLRPADRAVQLERHVRERLAQLVARPGGRGVHHAGNQRPAGLQLHRAGRGHLPLHGRDLRDGRRLERGSSW